MHLLIVEYLSFSVALTSIYPMFKKKKNYNAQRRTHVNA